LEEIIPDEPRSADEVPILLLAFTFVCGRRIVDGWVIQCGFCQDCVGGIASEFVLLVDTEYVAKESVVVCCWLAPCVGNVLHLACKSACIGLECFVVVLHWPSMYPCSWGGSDGFICSGFCLFGGGRHDSCFG
jgi:hypothetical protein